jgi:hypothetical protein
MAGLPINTLLAQMCPTFRAPPRQSDVALTTPHIRGGHIIAVLFPGTKSQYSIWAIA